MERRENKRNFAAVVFDMDGVIFDTERIVLECWKEVADRHHIAHIEDVCKECMGMNQEATVERFLARYGQDFPYHKLKEEMRELFFGPFYGEHLPVKAGAEELLTELRRRGIPVALATSTRQAVVLPELADAGLTEYFDQIICGDMVSHSKPHPEIFLLACGELGTAPRDTYAVEDSFNGIRAAYAGGLRPVMVPDQLEPDEEIRSLAEAVLPSLDEVQKYLLGE